MHKRRTILEALRTQLLTVAELRGCYIQRIGPAKNDYPHATLFAESESVETLTIHSPTRPQDRTLSVQVIGWVRGTPDNEKAESDLDNTAELIEKKLQPPANVDDMTLLSTDFAVSDDEPDIHQVTLTYQISYQTNENLT